MPTATDPVLSARGGRIKQGNTEYPPLCYFPIGYVYISVDSTNPSTYFGGTWQRLSSCFLYAADPNTDASATDPFRAGQSGGSRTKTIQKANLPNEKYEIEYKYKYTADDPPVVDTTGMSTPFGNTATAGNAYPATWYNANGYWPYDSSHKSSIETIAYFDKTDTQYTYGAKLQTESLNGGVTQTAMDVTPEYLSVYMWKRTA